MIPADSEKSEYRPCQRCGLAQRVDGSRTCYYCDYETKETLEPQVPYRRCPVCGMHMYLGTAAEGRAVLTSACGAVLDLETATLTFPGCTRTGKGVAGTNQKVKNDAKRALEAAEELRRAQELEGRPQRAAARQERRRLQELAEQAHTKWRVHRVLDADVNDPAVLLMLVETVTDEGLQQAALNRLIDEGALEELCVIANSRSRWATDADTVVKKLRP